LKVIVLKPPEMIGALAAGEIDGFLAWEPYPAKARLSGAGRPLAASRAIWPDHPCCVLAAGRRFLEEEPAAASAILRAHARATRFIHDFPDEAAAIAVRRTGLDVATVREAMKGVHYVERTSRAAEEELVRTLDGLGYVEVGDAARFVDTLVAPGALEEPAP
jgi:NitT/TauT family transport system substrate-binding protein